MLKKIIAVYRMLFKSKDAVKHLPLQEWGFHNIPGIPLSLKAIVQTLLKLLARNKEVQQAKLGLSKEYTIGGITANAYSFAYGGSGIDHRKEALEGLHKNLSGIGSLLFNFAGDIKDKLKTENLPGATARGNDLTTLFLDDPSQYALSWTTYGNVLRDASKEMLPKWSSALTDPVEATNQFFPIMAQYGVAYNLLILQKVMTSNISGYKTEYSKYWTSEMDSLFADGNLYIIDMSIYKMLEVQKVDGFERFTPATFTFLKQDSVTKKITPFAVHVSGYKGANEQFYELGKATDSTWIYALQAAKVSTTVYGIWLGHVYHWHIVTAAMAMTMFNNVPEAHPIHNLLATQSNYVIGFNDVLLLLWKEGAPPTSIITSHQFLDLINEFAKGRQYFDDDPTTTIEQLGLKEADFTVTEPWDQYPIVGYLLKVWDLVKGYTDSFVDLSYKTDAEVINDKALQEWMKASSAKNNGNISGLPTMNSKENLKRVLVSMLYRITVHGISRLDNTANPGMSFVGNYPPCLQHSLIPQPSSTFDTKELLKYMPNTGIIGEMITFYYTFVYSAPYDSIVPIKGVTENLFFPNGKSDPLNQSLINFRVEMTKFIEYYYSKNKIPGLPPNQAQIHQWPLHVET